MTAPAEAKRGEVRPLNEWAMGDLAQRLGVLLTDRRLLNLGDKVTIIHPRDKKPAIHFNLGAGVVAEHPLEFVKIVDVEGGVALVLPEKFNGNVKWVEVKRGGLDVMVCDVEKGADPSVLPGNVRAAAIKARQEEISVQGRTIAGRPVFLPSASDAPRKNFLP